jgi:hypothetical protein
MIQSATVTRITTARCTARSQETPSTQHHKSQHITIRKHHNIQDHDLTPSTLTPCDLHRKRHQVTTTATTPDPTIMRICCMTRQLSSRLFNTTCSRNVSHSYDKKTMSQPYFSSSFSDVASQAQPSPHPTNGFFTSSAMQGTSASATHHAAHELLIRQRTSRRTTTKINQQLQPATPPP